VLRLRAGQAQIRRNHSLVEYQRGFPTVHLNPGQVRHLLQGGLLDISHLHPWKAARDGTRSILVMPSASEQTGPCMQEALATPEFERRGWRLLAMRQGQSLFRARARDLLGVAEYWIRCS